MAAERLTTITEAWIRERLQLKLPHLGDVRSLSLPGTYEEKIRHLGTALRNFVRLKSVDLSCNGLTSVEGLLHLKMLERLNLYYNCISSVKEVKGLCKLPALRELDLRLNPLTKNDPHYRLYLVHAMPNLRKLDDCPVRDTERKAAIMQFSSDLLPHQKSQLVSQAPDHRSSDPRLASVDRLTKKLSFSDNSDDIVLNFGAKTSHLQQVPETEEAESKNVSESESCSSSQKQEPVKSILRSTQKNYGYTQSKVPQTKVSSHKKNSTSLKGVEGPRVTFNPQVEKRRPDSGRHHHKDPGKRPAKGHFTPNPVKEQGHQHDTPLTNLRPPSPRSPGVTLSDPSNPILHPPRLSYSSTTAGGTGLPQKTHHQKRGSYRKPLEMLLNLVDKHWKGERSLHRNSDFLSKAVQILSMMDDDISSREDEIRTLKGEVEGLKRQAEVRQEEQKIEVRDLSVQLEDSQSSAAKLNEQLKIVLEENVNLQKQLIKLEQQYLKSMMKTSPVTQIKEAQTEVDELRREIEGLKQKVHEAEKVKDLAHMLQESHRSLVATNEQLLGELRASGEP